MVDTCAVFKLPVCCAACGSQQYETLLRISQGKPLVCVECRQRIDLPRDNSAIFSRAVAFVESEQCAVGSPQPAVLADFAVNGWVSKKLENCEAAVSLSARDVPSPPRPADDQARRRCRKSCVPQWPQPVAEKSSLV